MSGPLHFHAVYGEHEAIIHIRELRVTCGTLPRRALAMVLEWAVEHRQDGTSGEVHAPSQLISRARV